MGRREHGVNDGQRVIRSTRLNIAPSAFIAPGAVLVGDVTVEDEASIWYGCILRGDIEPITVGARTNIQDGTIVHVDPGHPAVIGPNVTIGHRAVIHGCVLEAGCLIGMGAVLLTGSRVGAGALIAAGALLKEGFEVPPNMLAAGVPAKLRGELDDLTRDRVLRNNDHYVHAARQYREGLAGGGPHGGR